ncbi:MAG TPA: tetratricopeptide repeat protein [Vicinamibacteria bacterium]|nr:tetratricopeptide repeat protein [Vicinamibacteria bacterium]
MGAALLGLLGLLLLLTGTLAGAYREKEHELAAEWSERGEAALVDGHAPEAVEAFRTALAYARGDERLSLRLAQALLAAGRSEDARSYLLTLWERRPGDGVVNLELARLALADGRLEEAVAYYQGAVHGVWDEDPERRRREARHELVALWLGRGRKDQAAAELIAIAAALPPQARQHARVGRLFLAAGEPARAGDVFSRALELDARNPDALLGAGEAAFRLGDDRRARTYLQRAREAGAEGASNLLETVTIVSRIDPYVPRLSSAERRRRARQALTVVKDRIERCPASSAAPEATWTERLQALQARAERGNQLTDPEFVEDAMTLVFDVVTGTQACARSTPGDEALSVVEKRRGGLSP